MEEHEDTQRNVVSLDEGRNVQDIGVDATANNPSYNLLVPPPLLLPLSAETEAFRDSIYSFFNSTRVCDIIPENTKIIMVDSRMPLHITIRSLFEYSKPFAVVYDEAEHKINGCFDIVELMDYFLYLNTYFNDPEASFLLQHQHFAATSDLSNVAPSHIAVSKADVETVTAAAPVALQGTSSDPLLVEGITISGTADSSLSHPTPPQANATLPTKSPPTTASSSSLLEKTQHHDTAPLPKASVIPAAPVDNLTPIIPLQNRCSVDARYSNVSLGSTGPPPDSNVSISSETSFIKNLGEMGASSYLFGGASAISSLILAPWAYSLEKWREIYRPTRPYKCVSGKQTSYEALKILLEESVPYVVVWNEERSAPLSFLSPTNLLGHLVQSLRGNYVHFDLALKSQLKVGTFGNIVTVSESSSLIKTLQVLREKQLSAVPMVDANGCYVGCFSENHFFQLIFKSFAEDYSIHPDTPVIKIWEMLNQHTPSPYTTSTPATSQLLLTSHNPLPKRLNSDPVSAAPTGFATFPPYQRSNPAIAVNDISLRDAILYSLISDERRIFFIEGEGRTVTGVVTVTDLCKYLVDFDGTKNNVRTREPSFERKKSDMIINPAKHSSSNLISATQNADCTDVGTVTEKHVF